MATIYLASRSPRRAELLRQIGVDFSVRAADIDETPRAGEAAGDFALRMAREKALAVMALERPVLAADTVVEIDGRILGKPCDRYDAARMLGLLSGRRHRVWTGVALHANSRLRTLCNRTEVCFRALDKDEITAYWHSGEPRGKAGAYAIQGLGAVFIREIVGSYSGVMGLPLYETADLLREIGIDPLNPSQKQEESPSP